MRQRYMFDDGQAQTDAVLRVPVLIATTVEALEHAPLLLVGDADAAIEHPDHHPLAVLVGLGRHIDARTVRRIYDGVLHKLGERGLNLLGLAINLQRFVTAHIDGDATPCGLLLMAGRHRFELRHDVDAIIRGRQNRLLRFDEQQQIGDHVLQMRA